MTADSARPASHQITVRPATAADRTFVLGLVPRLRAFGPSGLRSPEALDSAERRTLEKAFDALPDKTALLIGEHPAEGALGVAYVETGTDYFTKEAHGHLAILAVAESGEGRGVAPALLEAVERWATDQGYRFVTLNVFAGNARARAAYDKAGYEPDIIRYLKKL
jgi:GNAT superfamily N-acetyltransferase